MFGLKKTLLDGAAPLRRQDTGGAPGGLRRTRPVGLAAGLVAGTMVATAMGWRPVEALAKGDLILTFDRGLQPLRGVTRGLHWDADTLCPEALWPLRVPAGALGNQQDMTLLPEQAVMIESDTADMLYGDPFTLIDAADLDGYRGIERMPPVVEIEVIQLQFDNDEVVFANSGALVHCPNARLVSVEDLLHAEPQAGNYSVLPHDEAAWLVDCLRDEDEVAVCPTTHAPAPNGGYAAAFA